MSINDLFVAPVEFEKTAMVKLSQNIDSWPMEIVQHLHEEHPYLADANSEVVMKQQDALRGYGYGLLKVGNEGAVRVPIIIKEWSMSPLDVWLNTDGEARPLNEDAIKEATQATSLGTPARGEVPGRVDASLYNRTYPPYDGKYVYASANNVFPKTVEVRTREYGSALSNLMVSEQEKKAWLEGLDPSILVTMKNKNTSGVIADFIKQASATDEIAEKVPVYGNPLPDAVILEDMEDEEGDPELITKFGKYTCQGSSSDAKYVGHVFPHVHDFSLARLPMTIFDGELVEEESASKKKGSMEPTCKRQASSVQPSIAGKRMPGDCEVRDGYPTKGDFGMWVEIRGEAAIALKPVKIMLRSSSREKHESNKTGLDSDMTKKIEVEYTICKYHCKDPLTGETFTVTKSPKINNVQKVGNDVMIPSSMKFVRLENAVNLKSDPEQVKTAQHNMAKISMDARYNVIKVLANRGSISVQGDGIEPQYWEGVTEGEAVECLANRIGGGEAAQEKIASRIARHIRDDEGGYKKSPVTFHIGLKKEAAEDGTDEARTRVAARINELVTGMAKVASSLDDAGLVDSVLSLEFLTPENVDKFAEMAPQFEQASSHLADLLIASRIGLQIEEHPVKTAMQNMSKVVQELRMLSGR